MILLSTIVSASLNLLAFALMNLVQKNYLIKLITTLAILNIGLLKGVFDFNLISIIVGGMIGISNFVIINADAYEEV